VLYRHAKIPIIWPKISGIYDKNWGISHIFEKVRTAYQISIEK
jgi:hypothetical protein